MNREQPIEQVHHLTAQKQLLSQMDDEIDLSELFEKIWKTRVAVFKVVAVLTVLFIVYMGIGYINTVSHTSYSRLIRFTFDGVEKGEYPNKTSFKLADVIAPAILHSVFVNNNLDHFNVSESEFTNSVTIEPYSKDYALILKKYEKLINVKKMSSDEISQLREKRSAELENSLVNSAKISMSLAGNHDLPGTLINKLLLDISKVWADLSINKRGVLNIDIPLYSSKIFDEDRITQLDYLIGFDLIDDNIDLILENVSKLLSLPNGLTVVDPDTGFKLIDLKKAINDIRDYDIQALITPIVSLGLAKNPDVVVTYYKYRIIELERSERLNSVRAEIAIRTLADYQNAGRALNQLKGKEATQLGAAKTGSVQLDGSFLNSVIELSRSSDDIPFRQELIRSSMEELNDAAIVASSIERMKTLIAAIKKEGNGSDKKIRDAFRKEINKKLPDILMNLRAYVDVTNRLYAVLSKNNLGNTGSLYKNIDSRLQVSRRSFSKKDLLLFIVFLVVAVSLTVIVGIVRQGRQAEQ